MKIKLVFDDWQKEGKSVYCTPKGTELSMGDFHSGTTFEGEIKLDSGAEAEIKEAMALGYQPIFWLTE